MACSAAVAVKVTDSRPSTVATAVFGPSSLPSVSLIAAWPLASVVIVVDDVDDPTAQELEAVVDDSIPPPAVTEKVTDALAKASPS